MLSFRSKEEEAGERENRLGNCVNVGGWVLFVRGGCAGLGFDCDGVRTAVGPL